MQKFKYLFALLILLISVHGIAFADDSGTKLAWFDDKNEVSVIKEVTYKISEKSDIIYIEGQDLKQPDIIFKNLPDRYEVRFHADYPDRKYVSEQLDGNFTQKLTYFQEKLEIFKVAIQLKGEAGYKIEKTKTGYVVEIVKGKIPVVEPAVIPEEKPKAEAYSFDGKLIVLDPGHGGYDPGAVGHLPDGTEIKEKDLNLNIALKVYKLLSDKGINVEMTRKTDMFVPLAERAEIANNLGAALFVSIHNNASDNPDASGTLTVYTPERGVSNLSSMELAQFLQDEMVKSIGIKDRGLTKSANMAVLRRTAMASAITESAFLSNEEDLALLNTEVFKQKIADGIANGIISALKKDAEIDGAKK